MFYICSTCFIFIIAAMKNRKYFAILFPVSVILFFTLSFTLREQPTNLARTAENLYAAYCASCHGEKLDRFAARPWVYGNSEREVFSTLKNGRPAIGMPPFVNAMTDEEIRLLAKFTIEKVAQVPNIQPARFNVNDTIRSLDLTFVLQEVAGSNMQIPWGMAVMPDGSLLVTEKAGKLFHVNAGVMKEVGGVPPVFVRGQGGLMDVVLHPNFKQNRFVYLSYADGPNANNVNTSIGFGEFSDGKLKNFRRIFQGLPDSGNGVHFGCRMFFDNQGYLFFGIGDRGRMQQAQQLDNHCGKIHRILDDGRIPNDNPFVGKEGAMPSIWSFGIRNPQGLAYDSKRNIIWENEHGPKGGDELNIIRKGVNYGWPTISFGINYDGTIITNDTARVGMEQPVHYWNPAIAPSSLALVTSARYPGWEGDLLSGSLSLESLERSIMKNNRVIASERLLARIGRIRNIMQGADGYLYVAVENPGKVYRIVPIK